MILIDKILLLIDSLILKIILKHLTKNILLNTKNKKYISKQLSRMLKQLNRQFRSNYKNIEDFPLSDKNTYENAEKKRYFFSRLVSTSGSSGEPFTFIRSKLESKYEQGFIYRALYMKGFNPGEPLGFLRSYVPEVGEKKFKHIRRKNHWMFSAYHLDSENMDKYLEIIIKKKIRYFFSYPSSIFLLSEYILNHKEPLSSVKSILVSSEMLHEPWIETIELAFPNAELINQYGNVEGAVLLTSCKTCNGFHTNNDYSYIECLGSQKDETELVGTGYLNRLFPMPRYRTEDSFNLVKLQSSNCERVDPVLVGKINGRSSDLIELENKKIPAVNFYTVMYKFSDSVKQFQLKKISKKFFELRIISNNLTEDISKKMVHELKKRLESDTEIKIIKVNEIPREAKSNKFKAII